VIYAQGNLFTERIVSMIQLATMRRAALPPQKRPLFSIYLDEFQSFCGTDSAAFQRILSQARNWNVSMLLAHQYNSQIPKEMRSAILGNVHTMIAFRLGMEDAKLLQAAFADAIPDKAAQKFIERLQNLSRGEAIVRLETAKNNFVMRTYPPSPNPSPNFMREVIEYSRTHYGRPVAQPSRASHPVGSAPPEAKTENPGFPPSKPENPELPKPEPESASIDPWQ
jgi:hypothetical protein